MNKRGGIVFGVILAALVFAILIIWALVLQSENNKFCQEKGFDKTIGWNRVTWKWAIAFGAPNRTYIDCAMDDDIEKFYTDEVDDDRD